MASKTKSGKDTVNSNGTNEEVVPEGFDSITPDKPSWWNIKTGGTIQGRLMGRFTGRNGPYYQIRLSANMEVPSIEGKGEAAIEKILMEGDTVSLGERSGLKILAPYAESDGIFDVFIKALEKVPLDGGQTWWRFKVATRTIKASSHPITAVKPEISTETDTSDIPF